MSIFDNESDFDDAYGMEDAMNMFSKLAAVSNDLTKLCVKAEIASGNKLSTADVQNIFKQNFQIIGSALESFGPNDSDDE